MQTEEQPDRSHLDLLGPFPSRLVFIMGCHRSGTTFLHNLLARCSAFDFISAYEVICYGTLIHNRLTDGEEEARQRLQAELLSGGLSRGIDHVSVDVNGPEEYGFILPGYDLFAPRITPDNLEAFREICRKKRWLAGRSRPLLLKEPNEFYGNLSFVQSSFPDADYIINHRHPLTVLASHIQSWTSVYESENPYLLRLNARYREIMASPMERMHYRLFMHTEKAVDFVLDHLVKAFQAYLEQIGPLKRSRCHVLRYEDLCRDSSSILGGVLDFIGCSRDALRPEMASPRQRAIPEVIRTVYHRRIGELKPYLDAMEYDLEPPS